MKLGPSLLFIFLFHPLLSMKKTIICLWTKTIYLHFYYAWLQWIFKYGVLFLNFESYVWSDKGHSFQFQKIWWDNHFYSIIHFLKFYIFIVFLVHMFASSNIYHKVTFCCHIKSFLVRHINAIYTVLVISWGFKILL